jgi:hypothetical protein
LLVMFHAALRHPGGRGRVVTLAVVAAVVVTGAAFAMPRVDELATRLDRSQHANATDRSNLKLEPVDFSSPDGAAIAAVRRTFDTLVRPYPWQVANARQRFGVIGTTVAWTLLLLMAVLALRGHEVVRRRLPPLVYVTVCLTLAYAVTTGNAGTGFRYRTHILIALAACVSVLAIRGNGRESAASAGSSRAPSTAPSAASVG